MSKMSGEVFRYAVLGSVLTLGMGILGAIGGYMRWDVVLITDIILVPVAVAKFFVHKYWVFQNDKPKWVQQPLLYAAILGTAIGAYYVIRYGLLFLYVPQWWAFGAGMGAAIVLRFVLFRRLFRGPPAA